MVKIGNGNRTRVEESLNLRRKFATAYNNLLRTRQAAGESNFGIKLQAATIAGFGASSYSEVAANRTRRTMASRMMRDSVVHEYLREFGLKPHPVELNEWVIDESVDDVNAQMDIENYE